MWSEEGARGVRSIRVAVARPGHGFGRGQLVDRRRANMAVVGVAVQPSGRVVAIWRRSSGRLAVALARRNHGFGRARNLAAISQPAAGTIPVDPRDGSVIVAYATPATSSPPVNPQAAVRTLTLSAGSFSAPTVVSQGPGTSPFAQALPSMVSGPAGVGVAYTQSGDPSSLNLVRRNGDGTWATPERIGLATYGADTFATGLQATLPADGSAVAAWSIQAAGRRPRRRGRQPDRREHRPPVERVRAASGADARRRAVRSGGRRVGRRGVLRRDRPDARPRAARHARGGRCGFATPVALTGGGDGDVLLAAGGERVVAAYQQGDRLQLQVVR